MHQDDILKLDAMYTDGKWMTQTDTSTGTGAINTGSITTTLNCYDYWHQYHYPITPVIHYGHTEDKATKAFKLAKALMDKKLIKIDKVKDFVTLMDEIIDIM